MESRRFSNNLKTIHDMLTLNITREELLNRIRKATQLLKEKQQEQKEK